MIYKLHYSSLFDDFIVLKEDAFHDICLACISSEFQKITLEPIEVFTSDELGGTDFPEFYYDNAVPLFSERVFDVMKENGVSNLLTKVVTVTDELMETSNKYILGLPPRIKVFDEFGSFDEGKIGNYLIFKTSDPSDNNIYVTEKLAKELLKIKPIGMELIGIDVLQIKM